MAKNDKTNVMRLLEAAGISYLAHYYPHNGNTAVDGITVAQSLGQNPEQVFKTLVTRCHSGEHAVFVIPVAHELDLKAAAKSVDEKSVEMIAVKDLLKITGYIRGGCSPIGMKKPFKTVIHSTAENYSTILFSAGKIGSQVEMSPYDLLELIGAKTADIIKGLSR